MLSKRGIITSLDLPSMLLLILPGCCDFFAARAHQINNVQLAAYEDQQVLFQRLASQTVLLHWILFSFVFVFIKFHAVPIGPFLQTIKVPLDKSPAPKLMDLSPKLLSPANFISKHFIAASKSKKCQVPRQTPAVVHLVLASR